MNFGNEPNWPAAFHAFGRRRLFLKSSSFPVQSSENDHRSPQMGLFLLGARESGADERRPDAAANAIPEPRDRRTSVTGNVDIKESRTKWSPKS